MYLIILKKAPLNYPNNLKLDSTEKPYESSVIQFRSSIWPNSRKAKTLSKMWHLITSRRILSAPQKNYTSAQQPRNLADCLTYTGIQLQCTFKSPAPFASYVPALFPSAAGGALKTFLLEFGPDQAEKRHHRQVHA